MSDWGAIEKALIEGRITQGEFDQLKGEAPKKVMFNGAWHDEAKLRLFLKLED